MDEKPGRRNRACEPSRAFPAAGGRKGIEESMYDDPDKQAAYRTILDYAVEQLMWLVMYAVNAFMDSPALPVVREKLQRISEQARNRLLSTSQTPEGKELAQTVYQCNEEYVRYVDSLAAGDGEAEEEKLRWMTERARIGELIAKTVPGSADLWVAMLHHETDLLNTVLKDLQRGRYHNMAEITSLLQRLATDMSDYMAKGVLHEHLSELVAP